MPFIARPLISATRSVITRSPLRARAAGISLPFAFFGSSSSPQQKQNQDNMSVQKSDSEWQAQLSPEQVCLLQEYKGRTDVVVQDLEAEGN
jgi:hypothetical protein